MIGLCVEKLAFGRIEYRRGGWQVEQLCNWVSLVTGYEEGYVLVIKFSSVDFALLVIITSLEDWS